MKTFLIPLIYCGTIAFGSTVLPVSTAYADSIEFDQNSSEFELLSHYWQLTETFGWVFNFDPSKPPSDDYWVYTTRLGWIRSHPDHHPDIYHAESTNWLRPIHSELEEIWFYDYSTETFLLAENLPNRLTVDSRLTLQKAETMMRDTANAIPGFTQFPIYTVSANWHLVGSWNWTAGFWPGCLWLMYDYTGADYWRTWAEAWTNSMTSQKDNTTTHDLGFMMFNSFGQGMRLGANPTEYASVLHDAANSLLSRFNPDVGAIRSWSWADWDAGNRFTVIVDNMMNLELLFWSARERQDAAMHNAAIEHARTTIRDFCRPDGSTIHVVVYNENSGEILEKLTHQGYSRDSTWARGQAWALYGFTTVYRDTGLGEFLKQAKENADFYLDHFLEEGIPYWDSHAPVTPDTPRDSSAAAIAASGLLELASLCELKYPDDANRYRSAAHEILERLISPDWFASIPGSNALLGGGTYNYPANHSDTALIWGDYYLLEALLRYLNPERLPTTPANDFLN